MRRASAVACAAIIGIGGLLANQALVQMVRHVEGRSRGISPRRRTETRPSSLPCWSRLSREQWLPCCQSQALPLSRPR